MMSEKELQKELAALELMTPGRLRERYRELFGDESRSKNRQWLYRRCAWRLRELARGGLSERARKRAMAILRRRPTMPCSHTSLIDAHRTCSAVCGWVGVVTRLPVTYAA